MHKRNEKLQAVHGALIELIPALENVGRTFDAFAQQCEADNVENEAVEFQFKEVTRKFICSLYSEENVTLAFYALAIITPEINDLMQLAAEIKGEQDGADGET